MSLVKNAEDDESVNVEGILANFFLKKFENLDSSQDRGMDKKRKKHKKQKSKKSKHRSRSSSYEEITKDSMKYDGDYSSSEEKDIKRLQRLKRLDTKDRISDILTVKLSESLDDKISQHSDSKINSNTDDIPYGPSLETLMGISMNDNEDHTKLERKGTDCADVVNLNEQIPFSLSSDDNEVKTSILSADFSVTENPPLSVIKAENADVKPSVTANGLSSEKTKSSRHSRSRSNSRSKSSKAHKRSRSRSKTRSYRSTKRSRSRNRSRSSSYSRYKKSRRSRSISKDREQRYIEKQGRRSLSSSRRYRKSRSRSNSRNRYSSQSKRRHRSRSIERSRYSRDRDPKHISRRRGSSSDHDSHQRKHSRSKSRERRSNSVQRRRSRSKSREQRRFSSKPKIDQAKILEIAQKNALSMIKNGTMPEGLSLDNIKKEQIISLKAGGKSVKELTDFCTKLSKKENDPFPDDDNAGNDNTNAESGFIHHPFKIKEATAITLNIKNAVQIPVKTHAEKFVETARLSSQFPVSSGNQHKQKELEWIPVDPNSNSKDTNASKALVPLSQPTIPPVSVKKETPPAKPAPEDTVSTDAPFIPLPPPDSALPDLPPPPPPLPPPPLPPSLPLSSFFTPTPVAKSHQPNVTLIDYPMITAKPYAFSSSSNCSMTPEINSYQMTDQYPAAAPVIEQTCPTTYVAPTSLVSPRFKSKKAIDVPAIVAQRFKALTKLQSNPNDAEALRTLDEAQACINDWVQSQQVPGLFTGSTGVKLLSLEELSGPRHWVYKPKKDIFTRAAPVTEGKGMNLMKKMGWNPGEGLGKNKEGSLEPLVLDIKTDKKGLVSEGEGSKKMVSSVLKDLQGKHPVSALMELCSKRKWKPPLYTLIQESGPSHKRLFLFKVEVNNVDYQAVTPVNNKKIAKADAAVVCLQSLSVFPKS